MTITEKTIIGNIEFNKNERDFLVELSNTLQKICNNNPDDCCDTCLLQDVCHQVPCEEAFNFLYELATTF